MRYRSGTIQFTLINYSPQASNEFIQSVFEKNIFIVEQVS